MRDEARAIGTTLAAARPQALAALLRYFRDLDLAEELVGESGQVGRCQKGVAVVHRSRRRTLGSRDFGFRTWEPTGDAVHAGVGVADCGFARAEDVVHDGASATELPQRSATGELADQRSRQALAWTLPDRADWVSGKV